MNLKEKLRSSELLLGSFIFLPEPGLVEIYGKVGFDFVILDMEHTAVDFKDIISLVRAGDIVGISTIIRVSESNPKLILKALETGADGICVPHIKTIEDAELIIKSAKYFPLGERGICGVTRAAEYSLCPLEEHFKSTNENVVILAIIEDIEGLKNINDVISLKGVDIVLIGPDDLSGSLGLSISKEGDKKILDKTVLSTINSIKSDDKRKLSMFAFNTDEAIRWINVGINMIIFADTLLFVESCKNTINRMRNRNSKNAMKDFIISNLKPESTLDEIEISKLANIVSEKIIKELEKYK